MKPIKLPVSAQLQWIAGVNEVSFSPLLVDACLENPAQCNVLLFEDFRQLSKAMGEIENLLELPLLSSQSLEIAELPNLQEYEHLDASYMDRQCDVIRVLSLVNGLTDSNQKLLICTTPDGLLQPLPQPSDYQSKSVFLKTGKEFGFEKLKSLLADELSYANEAICETPGQFAVRGGIIDVYPTNELTPYRIDFFGDEVDSIKTYDPTTQLTQEPAKSLTIYPSQWKNQAEETDSDFSLLNVLPDPCAWFLRNSRKIEVSYPHLFSIAERIKETKKAKFNAIWEKRDGQRDTWTALDEIAERPLLHSHDEPDRWVDSIPVNQLSREWSIDAGEEDSPKVLQRSEQQILGELNRLASEGYSVIIGVSKQEEKDRILNLREDWKSNKKIQIHIQPIPQGVIFHSKKNAVVPNWLLGGKTKATKGCVLVSESDLHPYLRIRIGRKKQRAAPEISQVDALLDFTELADGDHLVHQTHGICIFRGIHKLDYASHRESLSLEFAEGSMIHIPLNESHLLSRYVGLTKRSPKLGKIGSNQWEKDRKAAEKATMDLAAELLSLQAKRESIEGFAFPLDDDWMKQFETAFPYTETPDQLTAIQHCKSDLERPRPMDRLVCGDVGFGKTEVAMRAAFKTLEAGKQVAVLVPTTVLCQQHYHSFKERMAPFPVTVEMVSGFRTPTEQRQILQRLATGKIDLIVGTHRLLSKDVTFHDLGLFIIDEEHRFGVKQKEILKQMVESVDALTLSATPIPRTLYLALAGARDLSVIETPPRNRLPIETIVRSYDKNVVDRAIQAEVNRGGQVFYLHNRVQTIDKVADLIRERNPRLRVIVGHGQMEKSVLEKIMTKFVDGDYDLMVCTTIIESGLDIPNCNTLIIDGADKFGLAQLYQIRGRVGRFNRQAYAYLLLHGKKPVTSDARKRLSAIRQYNELGAGYRIAMRDLELRGAGNILGSAQSGHIAGVGFELYCRLLKQSISRIQKGDGTPAVRATVNLDFAIVGEPSPEVEKKSAKDVSSSYETLRDSDKAKWVDPIHAYIPPKYIHETQLRIEFYRKLASSAELDEIKRIRASMKDRFGKIPDETEALIRVAAIRCLAESKNLVSVECQRGKLMLKKSGTGLPKFVKEGTYFPRLTLKPPLLLLNDCISFVSKL